MPERGDQIGRYGDGPTPGEAGAAVLAAHVDTPADGPGAFYRLGAVKVGDQVQITRADRAVVTFTVVRVMAFEKTRFPTDEVYEAGTTVSRLRLVTCGGPTDARNEYRDNVVVFADLTKVDH